MAYNPISGFTLQVITSTGQVASDYYLKLYEANTTTPLSMATDSSGTTLLTKAKIGDKGMPVSNPLDNSTVFIPHVNASYRLVIYTSEADADANNTAEAYVNVPFVSTLLGASGVGTAAYLDTGTAADQVPTNADLGTAAQANTGTAAGQVPTNANLSASIAGTATFSGDVYTFSPSGTGFRPLQAGMYLSFRLPGGSSNSTTTPDINYDGSAYVIKWIDGSALVADDLEQAYNKQPILFYFDGTDMLISSDISGSNANGEWVKKSNGGQIITTITNTQTYTSPTTAYQYRFTFPKAFSSVYSYIDSSLFLSGASFFQRGFFAQIDNESTSGCRVNVVADIDNVNHLSFDIKVQVTGRWY